MLTKTKELAKQLVKEIESYEDNPTKACSARIRKLSLVLGKDGVHLRKHMINLDKKA